MEWGEGCGCAGPALGTEGGDTEVDAGCCRGVAARLSSHTELWLLSSPRDMQGLGAPRLSTEGMENEPPLIVSM